MRRPWTDSGSAQEPSKVQARGSENADEATPESPAPGPGESLTESASTAPANDSPDVLEVQMSDLDLPDAAPEDIDTATRHPERFARLEALRQLRKAGAGAPLKWLEHEFAAALKQAGSKIGASRILGCSPATVTKALARWPKLVEVLMDTEDRTIEACKGVVLTAALKDKNWKAASWYMATRRPEEWGRRRLEVTGANGAPIQSQHVHVHLSRKEIESLSDEQLEQLLDGDSRALPGHAAEDGSGTGEAAEDEGTTPPH